MMSTEDAANHADLTESAIVLRAGLALGEMSLEQLWISYLEVGGTMSSAELIQTLQGRREICDYEHDMLAQALNDHFVDLGLNYPVAYTADLELPIHRPARGTRLR
jgi:hypothetical protein